MKKIIRNISYLLLIFSLLPILSGCNDEDDVIEIFTGKTWKLSRLTTKDSNARFFSGLWDNQTDYEKSMSALDKGGNFTLIFEGSELNGEVLGTSIKVQGIKANITGSWDVDGKKHSLTINAKVNGSETDPLAKAFISGLQTVYKYEGDTNSLTLFYEDGQTTKIMGFIPQQ